MKITRDMLIESQCEVTRIEYMLLNGWILFRDYGITTGTESELIRAYTKANVNMLELRAKYKEQNNDQNI